MFIIITKILGVTVSAMTWTKNPKEGISHAKRLAKMRGYENAHIYVV